MNEILIAVLKNDNYNRCFYIDKNYDDDWYGIGGPSWSGWSKGDNELNEFDTYLPKDLLEKILLGDHHNVSLYDEVEKWSETKKGKKWIKKIKSIEWNWIMDEYSLSLEDMKYIFDNYPLNNRYFDRSIIGYIEEDAYTYAKKFCDDVYDIDDNIAFYIDYERMGNDLVSNAEYLLELDDERIVVYNI